MCLRPLCSGLLVQLCYGILSVGSTSGKLRHLLWSGNSTDLLFVLLGFHRMMFSLKRTGGKNISYDDGNSTRVSRALRMPGRKVKGSRGSRLLLQAVEEVGCQRDPNKDDHPDTSSEKIVVVE